MPSIRLNDREVMRSENLGCVVRYAKTRADLVEFGLTERATGDVLGYIAALRFANGAECKIIFMDWRVAVDFFARGARRANGPFPSDLRVSGSTPEHMQHRFREFRDMHKGGGRQGTQYTPTKAERGE